MISSLTSALVAILHARYNNYDVVKLEANRSNYYVCCIYFPSGKISSILSEYFTSFMSAS